jgi:hypothetical protein
MSVQFDFDKQRRIANAGIREGKKAMPFIYPQWQRLQQARRAAIAAIEELEAAERAWEEFGKDS